MPRIRGSTRKWGERAAFSGERAADAHRRAAEVLDERGEPGRAREHREAAESDAARADAEGPPVRDAAVAVLDHATALVRGPADGSIGRDRAGGRGSEPVGRQSRPRAAGGGALDPRETD